MCRCICACKPSPSNILCREETKRVRETMWLIHTPASVCASWHPSGAALGGSRSLVSSFFFSLPYTLHGDFSASMFMTRQMEGPGALIGSDMGLASASWSCKLLPSFSLAFSRVRDSAEMSVAHKTKGLNLRSVASSEAVFSAWMVHAY